MPVSASGPETPVYEAIAVSISLPIIVYAIAHFRNKSHGIDMGLAFKTTPPE